MLPPGILLFAAACILQTQLVYGVVDQAIFGGTNATNVLYRALVIGAHGALEIMVLRAGGPSRKGRESLVWIAVGVIILLHVVIFAGSTWDGSDTYLSAYRGTFAREAFWSLLPITALLLAIHVGLDAGRTRRAHGARATRWGLTLIWMYSFAIGAWAVESMTVSVMRLRDVGFDPTLSNGVDPVAATLLFMAIAFAASGVTVASAPTQVDRFWDRVLLVRLWPTWRRGIVSHAQLALGGVRGRFRPFAQHEAVEGVLFRMWIEVVELKRTRGFQPTSRQEALIASVGERFAGNPDQADSTRPLVDSWVNS